VPQQSDGRTNPCVTAAKAALRRKKLHEKTLEQTSAQIAQVEQQIYSIEAANINQETLNAMKNAGNAMKDIHGNLTLDKVDDIMEGLREQHVLGEEINNAIANAPLGEQIDEQDLEDELEGMEQEAMDERMLKTGPTPVGGEPAKLPSVSNQPRKLSLCGSPIHNADLLTRVVKGKAIEEDDEEAELRKLQAEMAM
jgi:charged multivesicular body protein 4A/B